MSELFSFGAWVRRRRRALDLTREELASLVGCSVVTIRRIETDERRPSKQLAVRLAGCLQLPSVRSAHSSLKWIVTILAFRPSTQTAWCLTARRWSLLIRWPLGSASLG